MITVDLAAELAEAGLPWEPRSGDRFAIPGRELDGEVFVVSEMTIDSVLVPGGALLRFNGTTEWALDSISQEDVLWLPHEAQLRALLGDRFRALHATDEGFEVETTDGRHGGLDAECAYARAVLAALRA